MNVIIVLEQRFLSTPEGKIWTNSGGTYSFWTRYLKIFDSVTVMARVKKVENVLPGYNRADGYRVSFIQIPYYIGPLQYLLKSIQIKKTIYEASITDSAIILRIPGQVSSCMETFLLSSGHPYAVEVVGDPYDVFSPGSINHPLRTFFRWLGTKQLKRQCLNAVAASYVTEYTLQKRYPNLVYSTHYSSIDMQEDSYDLLPRVQFGIDNVYTLIFVGTMAQLYKAPDVLIDAVAICIQKGIKLRLKLIGAGKFRCQLEEQAKRLGVSDLIKFLGQISAGEAIRNELIQSDIFILPSRTEGLPRAMIEAMACALPCIGTNIGGFPELLSTDDLVPPGDAKALADKIESIITNPERMQAMSARNLEKSKNYRTDILEHRRNKFYSHIHEQTQLWQNRGAL